MDQILLIRHPLTFPPFGRREQCCLNSLSERSRGGKLSFLLGTCMPGVGLLGLAVILCFIVWGAARLSAVYFSTFPS